MSEPGVPEITDVLEPEDSGDEERGSGAAGPRVEADPSFEALLDHLVTRHGFDFTGYKRATLGRRVRRRMETVSTDTVEEYLDHLQVHPDEFGALFDSILINVTAFFRDPSAWEFLQTSVVPRILARGSDDSKIRVWSAGCASGEEAYTLAMVFCEVIGVDAFKERVKIYATDVDEDSLAKARHGGYTAKDVSAIPEHLRARYFEAQGQRHLFRGDLRRSVIFGRLDLVQDAPISRLDLLVSRNTLMYFTAETQARVIHRFHYALNDDGFLFLGRAEMLVTHANLFTPVSMRHRCFVKVTQPTMRHRFNFLAQSEQIDDMVAHAGRQARLRDLALDATPLATVVIDADSRLVSINSRARSMFGVDSRDIGRRLQDLEISYRPVELRGPIDTAAQERRQVLLRGVERVADGRPQQLDVVVAPVLDTDQRLLGASVTFTDVTAIHRMQAELTRNRQELETAYEELQSTNEELETTNEELQSTVEELETTNEELQSANEELETMNEELQSTNGQLQTINTELRDRTDELDRINVFMGSVLTSLRIGVVVVDLDLRVQVWNGRAEDLWGLRADEVEGQPLLALDFGLPIGELTPAMHRVLAGEIQAEEVEMRALNRRGRTIICRVTVSPLLDAKLARHGLVLLMDPVDEVPRPDTA